MAYSVGYNGMVKLNGLELCATKWSVSTKVDEIDTTSFCDNGFVSWLGAAADADITIEGILGDAANEDPFEVLNARDLGDLKVGSTVVIEIYPNETAAPAQAWLFPSGLLTSWAMEGAPRDAVRYTLTAKGNGVWDEPDI
jgi:hypothetical protein